MLPDTIFDSILANDLYDSSVTFTIYLLNPKPVNNIRHTYNVTGSESCSSSLFVHYSESLQYMLIDVSSFSSSYGTFEPNYGFRYIHYPRLFSNMDGKRVFNPSFIPEIAQVIHDAVSRYLYPDIHFGIFSSETANRRHIIDEGPAWDYGIVRIEIVTIVEEVPKNNYETYIAQNRADFVHYWSQINKQLNHLSLSQKQLQIETRFLPLSSVPNFSLLLAESIELLSTNHTTRRNDMYAHIRSDLLFSLLARHKSEIWREFGFAEIERGLQKETVGDVTLLPVFLFVFPSMLIQSFHGFHFGSVDRRFRTSC